MTSRVFTKHQFGKETTNGTAVAADTMIVGGIVPGISPDRVPRRPMENIGVRADSYRAHILQVFWAQPLTLPEGYFQILPALLSIGLVGDITAVEQTTSQGDMLWDFDPSHTADNALDSLTYETGDDTEAYEIEYVMAESFGLSFQVNQGQEGSPVELGADLFGRQVTDTTFTGGLSLPSPEPINGKLSRLYKDSTWANAGVTELSNILRGGNLEILNGTHPKFLGSANQYFDEHGQGPIAARLGLTLERGAASDAIFDDFQAQTERLIRLAFNGSQIGTGDTHNLTVDLFGTFESVTPLNAEDRGNNIDVAEFVAHYDPTGAKNVRVQVTTDVSAI